MLFVVCVYKLVQRTIREISDGHAENTWGGINRSDQDARLSRTFVSSTGVSVAILLLSAIQIFCGRTLLRRLSQPVLATAITHAGSTMAIAAVAGVWIVLSGVIRRRILEISDGYTQDWAGHGETTTVLVPPQVKSLPQQTDADTGCESGPLEPIASWVEARLRSIAEVATPSGDSSSGSDAGSVKDASSTSVGGVWEFPF